MASTIPISSNLSTNITSLGGFVSAIASTALIIAGILTFLYLVYGGVMWILSSGDKAKVESSRERITHALIGLAIVASSWAIFSLIDGFFELGIADGKSSGSSYSQNKSNPSPTKCSTSSAINCQGKSEGQDCKNDKNTCRFSQNLGVGSDGNYKCVCQ